MDSDTLHDTAWDVVICGTGIGQSLLALALSRSGKKILHIDRNRYYGGTEAAFSLEEASSWVADQQKTPSLSSPIRPISVINESSEKGLAPSRSYTLSLAPHVIYSRSSLLPKLVSSGLHNQIEFQAVGPWWMITDAFKSTEHGAQRGGNCVSEDSTRGSDGHTRSNLRKVPGTREDVFADDTLPVREKRSLMKFLRWVISEPTSESQPSKDTPLSETLTTLFGVAPRLHLPLVALSLSYNDATSIATQLAVPRLKRHLKSIGAFGPGFGAVMPKYGGLAEIGQVACRASAVGGAVYVLGRNLQTIVQPESPSPLDATAPAAEKLQLILSDGENVRSRFVVGSRDGFPSQVIGELALDATDATNTIHSINIISSPLEHLFPTTSENGPRPAGVVVVSGGNDQAPISDTSSSVKNIPTYMLVHSSDSGECPAGQCILYASTSCLPSDNDGKGSERLNTAILRLISNTTDPESAHYDPRPEVLWSMSYLSTGRSPTIVTTNNTAPPPSLIHSTLSGRALVFPPRSADLAFDDSLIDSVKEMWKRIVSESGDGDGVDEALFLTF